MGLGVGVAQRPAAPPEGVRGWPFRVSSPSGLQGAASPWVQPLPRQVWGLPSHGVQACPRWLLGPTSGPGPSGVIRTQPRSPHPAPRSPASGGVQRGWGELQAPAAVLGPGGGPADREGLQGGAGASVRWVRGSSLAPEDGGFWLQGGSGPRRLSMAPEGGGAGLGGRLLGT